MVQSREMYERSSSGSTVLPLLRRSWEPETSRVDVSTGYERCPKVELSLKILPVVQKNQLKNAEHTTGRQSSKKRERERYTPPVIGHTYEPSTVFECVSFYHSARERGIYPVQKEVQRQVERAELACEETAQAGLPQIKEEEYVITESNILNEYDYLIPQCNECSEKRIAVEQQQQEQQSALYIPFDEGFRAFYLRERSKTMLEDLDIQCRGRKVMHVSVKSVKHSHRKAPPTRKRDGHRNLQKPDALWRLDDEEGEVRVPPIQIVSYRDNYKKVSYKPPRTSQTEVISSNRGAICYPHTVPNTAWPRYSQSQNHPRSFEVERKGTSELPVIVDPFNMRQNIFRPLRARLGPTPGQAVFLDKPLTNSESSLKGAHTFPQVNDRDSPLVTQTHEPEPSISDSKNDHNHVVDSDVRSESSTRANMTPLPPSPNPSRTNLTSRLSCESHDVGQLSSILT